MASALGSAISASIRSHERTRLHSLRSNGACCISFVDPGKSRVPSLKCRLIARPNGILGRPGSASSRSPSEAVPRATNYEFSDGISEVELRLDIVSTNVQSSKDIVVDVDESSVRVRAQKFSSLVTIFEISHLYEKIKPSETIWFIDEEQLVINLKKYDTKLQWPDIMETWGSLTKGLLQLLKGTSIYLVGESTEVNQKVAGALASGLGGESRGGRFCCRSRRICNRKSHHIRTVVATLGKKYGIARRSNKWRHLYAGFTVWLSQTDANDETSAKEEAGRHINYGHTGYSNAEVVVKFSGWESDGAQTIAQACLSALKRLIMSDNQITVSWNLDAVQPEV